MLYIFIIVSCLFSVVIALGFIVNILKLSQSDYK